MLSCRQNKQHLEKDAKLTWPIVGLCLDEFPGIKIHSSINDLSLVHKNSPSSMSKLSLIKEAKNSFSPINY